MLSSGPYVKIRATWARMSPSGCESSWNSLLLSWEDSSSMTLKRQSCFCLSRSATWAEGLQALKFPANVSSLRSTGEAVCASKSSTTEAGACDRNRAKPFASVRCVIKPEIIQHIFIDTRQLEGKRSQFTWACTMSSIRSGLDERFTRTFKVWTWNSFSTVK